MIRRLATFLAVVFGLLILSAVPADARPLIDPSDYLGPTTSAHFAGQHVTAHIGGQR